MIHPLSVGAVAFLKLVSIAAAIETYRGPDEVGLQAAVTVGVFILLAGVVFGGWRAFMIATKNAPAIKNALTLWSLGAVVAWIGLVGVGIATYA